MTLIATANGNLTAAATWATVDATALLDSEAAVTNLTTSYVESQAFTPGAITIDGIAVKVSARATTPTGTFSVRLAQGGALVAGTEVTINVSDVPLATALATSLGNGWIFFKFAAPVVLLAVTPYTVSAKTSNASQIALYRNATAGNWSRMLRTTTTAAPAAADNWFILGEWTAAATKTNRAVTMDSTATTDYGGGSTTIASFGIGVGGTLTWGTTAATAYRLRLSGILILYASGTMTMGTDPTTGGTAVPRDSSAELQFDCAADGDFGIIVFGTLQMHGLSRTDGKNVVQCLLNTDEAIGQTVLGVDTDCGWLSGDEVAIASTSQTAADAESGSLASDAAAATITLSVAITAAHSGTSPNQAEVILLTRNVRIVAVTTTAVWYGQASSGSTINATWTQFRYFGTGTTTKRAVFYMDGTGPVAFSLRFCAFANGEANCISAAASGVGTGITFVISDTVFYAAGVASNTEGIEITVGAAGVWNLTRCTAIGDIGTTNTSTFMRVLSGSLEGFTLSSVRVSSSLGSAFEMQAASTHRVTKLFTGCVFHCLSQGGSPGAIGLSSTGDGLHGVRFVDTQFRRMSITGAGTGAILTDSNVADLVLDGCTFVGCGTGGFSTSGGCPGLRMIDCVFAGDPSFSQAAGINLSQASTFYGPWRFDNCTFGVGTAHVTADVVHGSIDNCSIDWTFVNCNLASATEFSTAITTAGNTLSRSVIRRQRKDGTTNVHESFFPNFGTIAYEATTFRTLAPSEKMTPTVGVLPSGHEEFRLRSSVHQIPVASGKQITVSAYARKDGAYNGGQPRLVMRANAALGLDADLVLKTMTGAANQWEQLSGQHTPAAEEDGFVEVYVDCDGSAGNVYVDDWSAAST